jgi:hypothetical protein
VGANGRLKLANARRRRGVRVAACTTRRTRHTEKSARMAWRGPAPCEPWVATLESGVACLAQVGHPLLQPRIHLVRTGARVGARAGEERGSGRA